MSFSDRILLGLVDAMLVLGVVGIIVGIFDARNQFEIGRRFGCYTHRVEDDRD
ncbi:MAG: hypothetical protein JWM87_2057 [Candidatus Eremiobacteraeota bacterium]|nr:hypothetical protein [Candidatus Eremiobacteraeota bacterium]